MSGAVLACGPHAVASHRTAAALWRFGVDDGVPFHVSGPGNAGAGHADIVRHRADPRPHTTVHRGVPITVPARTIVDLATDPDVSKDRLDRAIHEARIQTGLSLGDIERLLGDRHRRRGTQRVRQVLDRHHVPTVTRSELERRLVNLARDARLPRPQTNTLLHGYEVDALWRPERTVVEVDGMRFHGTPYAKQRDRLKSNALQRHGYAVLHFGWGDLAARPLMVAAEIAATLATRAR